MLNHDIYSLQLVGHLSSFRQASRLSEQVPSSREDPKILGTAKDSSLLQPASTFYKTFAIDCSRAQVSVDMFLFSASYQDVATLGEFY